MYHKTHADIPPVWVAGCQSWDDQECWCLHPASGCSAWVPWCTHRLWTRFPLYSETKEKKKKLPLVSFQYSNVTMLRHLLKDEVCPFGYKLLINSLGSSLLTLWNTEPSLSRQSAESWTHLSCLGIVNITVWDGLRQLHNPVVDFVPPPALNC